MYCVQQRVCRQDKYCYIVFQYLLEFSEQPWIMSDHTIELEKMHVFDSYNLNKQKIFSSFYRLKSPEWCHLAGQNDEFMTWFTLALILSLKRSQIMWMWRGNKMTLSFWILIHNILFIFCIIWERKILWLQIIFHHGKCKRAWRLPITEIKSFALFKLILCAWWVSSSV